MRSIAFLISLLLTAIILALLLLFISTGTVQSTSYAQTSAPSLSVAAQITATAGSTVTVPILFRRAGRSVVGVAFSIDIDPACLQYEVTKFNLPPQQNSTVSFDPNDTKGELDLVITDYSPPFSTIPDADNLVLIIFNTICSPAIGNSITTPVKFSSSPAASFSNGEGQAISGGTNDGFITIEYGNVVPIPTPIPTEVFTASLAATMQASTALAKIGEIITYTYQITNTGNISLSVDASDDKLGKITLVTLPGETDQELASQIKPGESRLGFNHFQVGYCDPPGLLVSTLTVLGTTPQGLITTAELTTSVFISNPVLAPTQAETNTIYLGCAIRLAILPTQRTAESFQMVIIAGQPPPNLILNGVQQHYPYDGLHSVADKTGELLGNCENQLFCTAVNRITFSEGAGYWIDSIDQVEKILDLYLPFIVKPEESPPWYCTDFFGIINC